MCRIVFDDQKHSSRPRRYAQQFGAPLQKLQQKILKKVDSKTRRGALWNHAAFNAYSDGKKWCRKHRDNERSEHTGSGFLVNIGATRTFQISESFHDDGRVLNFEMKNGDCFMMHDTFQKQFYHSKLKNPDAGSSFCVQYRQALPNRYELPPGLLHG